MSIFDYDGINNVLRDASGQIEFNRRKNVEQDQRLNTLSDQVNDLISQSPAGFLSRVYYALTRGAQTYRFGTVANYTIAGLPGNVGDAYEFTSALETANYISAIGIQKSSNQISVIIRGDYNLDTSNFTLINMRTGDTLAVTLISPLSLYDASYLGDYSAQDNQNKQITALYDLETNEENVVFASVDYSNDGVYNWVKIGKYTNGIDGTSIFVIDDTTDIGDVKAGSCFIWDGSSDTYSGYSLEPYDLWLVTDTDNFTMELRGNIKGDKGDTGNTGSPGTPGANGYTPYIQDGNWYINGVDTGVQAVGQDGADGANGQAFAMQSGLYSTPANYGETGNDGPNGETLLELPTLPQLDISGKGYVVYDPLTTPLDPFYDLYYANNGDVSWTIIHPFSGMRGADGANGYTPYIQDNHWYINGVDTGVQATGNQGVQGPTGLGWFVSSANITAGTTSINTNTVTVPTGYSVKVGDIVFGVNYGFARVTAVNDSPATLSLSYLGILATPSTCAELDGGNLSASDVTAWQTLLGMGGKADKDASNLSASDISDWKTALGFGNKANVDASNLSSSNIESFNSALGASQLVAEVSLTTAASSITISNLDMNADGGHYFVIATLNGSSSPYNSSLQFNGVTTGYVWSQSGTSKQYSSGPGEVTPGGWQSTSAGGIEIPGGAYSNTLVLIDIMRDSSSKILCSIRRFSVGDYMGSALAGGMLTTGQVNLTSLTITASSTQFGVGTRIKIYKYPTNTATRPQS